MEKILGPKSCKSCNTRHLDWDRKHYQESMRWRLAEVFKDGSGQIHYQPHICKKPEPIQKQNIVEKPRCGNYYCLNHPEILVNPQDITMKNHFCSGCKGTTLRLNYH